MSLSPPSEVDVIIVGGGAAGCVVAGRLARADPTLQIAIIEAGQDNKEFPSSYMPALYLSHLAPNSTTVNFYSETNPSPHCAGRAAIVPVGGMLGGGSSVNFLMYTRGSASDYDAWNTEGITGWEAKDIIPLARKTEDFHAKGDSKLHGKGGNLEVSYGGHQSKIGEQFIHAVRNEGVYAAPYLEDIQDFKTGHGLTQWAKWISPKTGRRQDAANGFVHPVLATQTNLHLLTESKTLRVVLDANNHATGVEYCHNPLAKASYDPANPPKVGETHTMKARKMVVVSSGAFGSPAILERSGIGAKDVLAKAGIDVKVELDGVGSRYEDHQLTMSTYRCAADEDTLDDYLRGVPEVHAAAGETFVKEGKGIIATNAIDAGMKMRPTPAEVAKMGPAMQKVWKESYENVPDRPLMFGGVISSFLGDHSLLPSGKYMMAGGYLEYPMSHGHVHVTSADPFSAPDFDAGFLNHEADMAPQVWTYKVLREILRRMPTFRGEVAAIHPKFAADSAARCFEGTVEEYVPFKEGDKLEDLVYTAADDEAVAQWMRENVGTTWHSCGTCPMKAKAAGGVVDGRLNVYGTTGLKVADLSIIPSNVGSNTYSVALTVGEKAAVLIAEDLGITV